MILCYISCIKPMFLAFHIPIIIVKIFQNLLISQLLLLYILPTLLPFLFLRGCLFKLFLNFSTLSYHLFFGLYLKLCNLLVWLWLMLKFVHKLIISYFFQIVWLYCRRALFHFIWHSLITFKCYIYLYLSVYHDSTKSF